MTALLAPVNALLRTLLLISLVCGAIAPMAAAQGIDLNQPPVTKEDLEKAKESSSSSTDDGTSDVTLGLVIIGGLLLAGAAAYIFMDARDRTGDRGARVRPLTTGDVGKGAPKTMFTGAAEPGGKVGKQRKRSQGRRQRNARKANRPK